jgi:DNA polymerase-1
MANKFLIIDGNSLLFRAYHALPPLSASSGQPTGALLGFAEMLMNVLEQEQPDLAAIVFDAPGPTFRDEKYAEYKATRPPVQADLLAQIRLAHDLAQALGIKLLEVPGVEADDVIATLAGQARANGHDVLIVSGDRDLVQIVRPGIRVLATVKGFTDTRLYDEDLVREEYGLEPPRIVDLKGLMGDTSDNIPGARGIGRKTARQLLEQFGSVEAIYRHLDEIEPLRVAEALREGKDMVDLSVDLARVADDVEIGAKPDDCRWKGFDLPELRALFIDLELNKLMARLPEAEQPAEHRISVAHDPKELARLVDGAKGPVGMAVGVLGERAAGVAFAAGDEALYVPLGQAEGAASLFDAAGGHDLRAEAARILADENVRKTGADLKADMASLEAAGLELAGDDFDVALAAYLLTPQRGDRALEALAARYLGWQIPPAAVVDVDSAAEALGRRALAFAALRPMLERELENAGAAHLFREIEMPLIRVLHEMECAGITVDRKRLQEVGAELSDLIEGLAGRIYKAAGHEFNIDSPKQLGVVLFDELKLPRARTGRSGYSTSADILSALAEENEIARLVMEYREYTKLRSTYVDGLLRLADEKGRVHTSFEQMVVATGRLSSRNPNLQNIPVRSEWGRHIRACFVAPREDFVLISADYSQIELRILAHLSGDPALLDAFTRGEDVHRRTASLIFDVPPEGVDSDMRRVAKTVNFAVIYGMGPQSLAQSIGVTRQQAEKFIREYFADLPKVKQYLETTIKTASERLYVETIFGRRRPLPELASGQQQTRSYAERAAGNAPIQGSAADIMKIAMVRLARELHGCCPEARLLLQVHDELVLEAPRTSLHALAPKLREVMSGAAQLAVPLTVDVKYGPNWRDMEELEG